jgi:glycosyltransferase involved in cell wall biosynthesis
MKVSLILATKGRVDELARCIDSLAAQQVAEVELIVVDQNEDDRLESILARALPFPLLHLRSEAGLSRSRNIGLPHATGSVIAFPDDDCWYPAGLLARVVDHLEQNPGLDGLTGRSEDGQGNPSGGLFSSRRAEMTMHDVFKMGISYTIFLRAAVCASVGAFDEELGVGAGTPFGAGEESDYLIRALKAGRKIEYLPDLVVYHPNPPTAYKRSNRQKAFRYGMGMGRVISKHGYGFAFKLRAILRPFGGALLSLLLLRVRKAAYHLSIGRGRLCGLYA